MTTGARTYTVTGMICGHCALSLREELTGVEQVEVELESGRLSVTGAGFSDDEVRQSVRSAGYALVDASANGDGDGGAE